MKFDHLERETPSDRGRAGTIPKLKDSASGYPLSWFQERLWILNQKNPDDVSYNVPVLFRVEGALDTGALQKSLTEIVRRHEALRTRFEMRPGGETAQFITPATEFELPVIPVEESEIRAHTDSIVLHRFNLSTGPVIVGKLLRLDEKTHFLLVNVHHIVCDAWSIVGIFMRELQQCYAAFCTGTTPKLPPLKIQYRDFAVWQRAQDVSSSLTYWKKELAGYEDTLEMPSDFLRRPQSGETSETFTYKYPVEFSRALDEFSKRHRVTLFIALLAGLGLTVNRYTGRDDLCIGTTAAGRNLVELEPLIGFLVNILPLRMRIDESMSTADFLEYVRKLTLAGFDRQMAAFEEILYSYDNAERGKKNPLVPIIMRHQTFPHARMDQRLPGDVKFSGFGGISGGGDGDDDDQSASKIPARCEIEMSYSGDGEALELEIVYASDLYTRETIERLLAHHRQVLTAMFEDDSKTLSELSILSDEDVRRLCEADRRELLPLSTGATFVDRFEAQAEKTPESIACYDKIGERRYKDIDLESSLVARDLLDRGIHPGDFVGVCLDRGTPLLSSMLGIWKAGAAYVPLDPSYPEAYLHQILADAAPRLVIGTDPYRQKLGLSDDRWYEPPPTATPPGSLSKPAIEVRPDGESLAYLMYTSGSTGVPKGVKVPHRQLMNWLEGLERMMPFAAGEMIAQKTTMAFAVSVKELFAGLMNGVPLVFMDSDTVQNPPAFIEALAKYQISRLNIVPSHLKGVLDRLKRERMSLPSLKYCITAGEPLTAEVVRDFRAQLPDARLINNYGCTELNDITYYDTAQYDGEQGFVPIGKPIQNTTLYVLDRSGRLVPEGVAGELHVETLSMSNGYHNMEEMTAERYMQNRFNESPISLLYNTGDVVKRLSDGNIEFIGRWDFQVKVRGFRVDVRQVEKVLGDFSGMGARAVKDEGERLVAFFTKSGETDIELGALREFLQARLPSYMVPDTFVEMDKLPTLPNGKMNRRALKTAAGTVRSSDVYEAPETIEEKTLALIWSEVLEVPSQGIGRQTHFFEIGGHSLAATRVAARIKDQLHVDIGLSEIFELPILSALSDRIRIARQEAGVEQIEPELPKVALDESPSPAATLKTGARLLEDKVILVTGVDRAFSRTAVRVLASHGATLVFASLRDGAHIKSIKSLAEREGGRAEFLTADITDAGQIKQTIDKVREQFGRIDVLAADADVTCAALPFAENEWESFEQQVSGALKTVTYPCRAVIPEMQRQGGGSIVVISNRQPERTDMVNTAQRTAQAAVDTFVRALAGEVGGTGIRVNMAAQGGQSDNIWNRGGDWSDTTSQAGAVLPGDIAEAILFLASDLSRFLNGSFLPLKGL